MCLIIFAHQADARFPLVVAANRDEFYSRPTQHAHFWPDPELSQPLLAGRDLQAGGTWLGMTTGGRFAAVTNIRDPSQPERKPRSRGELTRAFLEGSASPQEYCDSLAACYDEYAGYNLLVGDGASLCYVNNHARVAETLAPGIYGLSNGLLNAAWPKITKGRTRLKALLDNDAAPDTDSLLALMLDSEPALDTDLPRTGVSIELERALSSAFIRNTERHYGTLCSTAILVDAQGNSRFSEQNYDESGQPSAAHLFRFTLTN